MWEKPSLVRALAAQIYLGVHHPAHISARPTMDPSQPSCGVVLLQT